jgi:glycosyltransferase involved in cell wall biosynthesis
VNVLFATGVFPPSIGGPATYVAGLGRELVARGIGVEVVTYGRHTAADGTQPYPVRRVAGTHPVAARYAAYFAAVRTAAGRADLVYLQDPLSSGLPGLLAARARGRPALLKIVGDAAWEIGREAGWVEDSFDDFQRRTYSWRVEAVRRAQRWVARGADGVLVPSAYLERTVQGWGVGPERIDVVRNAVPALDLPDGDKADLKRRLGLEGRTVLISVGRLVPWKGFDVLLHTVAHLRTRRPDLTLLVVGEGECRSRLEHLASALGLGDAVVFTGRLDRSKLALHLRASDVFVLLSTYEGFSHVLLEAMQAELAVVATDAGGNRELIEDGRSGRLVRVHDREQVARIVEELCADAGARRRLGLGARQAVERLAWPAMVEATLSVFDRVLRARHGRM